MSTPIKPGTDNKPAGTYHETGVNGQILKTGRTVHIASNTKAWSWLEKVSSCKCRCSATVFIFQLLLKANCNIKYISLNQL